MKNRDRSPSLKVLTFYFKKPLEQTEKLKSRGRKDEELRILLPDR